MSVAYNVEHLMCCNLCCGYLSDICYSVPKLKNKSSKLNVFRVKSTSMLSI